ncbi:Lrp/AsnC family transcriptional regulator [Streptomyces monticola]|uniref:Lrp/AsnC family transcriptional regulator n=1 Tax=Streptomyces monticola TaxID=2666263 RepID=A0ABW2JBS8_9ACTN
MERSAKPSFDELDHRVLQALQLDGRAPFRRIAAALDVSENTVARRYRTLCTQGLRIVARTLPERLGDSRWLLRIQCAPDATTPLAEALARLPESSYVSIDSAGTQIHCGITAPDTDGNETPVLANLHRMSRVTEISAHCLLRVYEGDPPAWYTKLHPLTPEQTALAPPRDVPAPQDEDEPALLDDADRALITHLADDARATFPQLAAATGLSTATAKRHLDRLRASGLLQISTEFPPRHLGYRLMSYLWLRVDPSCLHDVGTALAGHRPISFAAATTGPYNLVATTITRSTTDLYRYLTDHVGHLPGIQYVETAPALRQIKRLA